MKSFAIWPYTKTLKDSNIFPKTDCQNLAPFLCKLTKPFALDMKGTLKIMTTKMNNMERCLSLLGQHPLEFAKLLLIKAGGRRSFNTTAVWEQYTRSYHKGATSMQSHPAVK